MPVQRVFRECQVTSNKRVDADLGKVSKSRFEFSLNVDMAETRYEMLWHSPNSDSILAAVSVGYNEAVAGQLLPSNRAVAYYFSSGALLVLITQSKFLKNQN